MTPQQEPSPARLYEDYLVPGIHARWTPVLLEHAAPEAGEHALDVACGTGVVARRLAPRLGEDGRVVALDINPDMLEVARGLSEPDGAEVEWREGEAASLPDGPFDLVTCQQGLQFFPDRPAAAREMRRVLAPGGRAVASVFQGLDRHPVYEVLLEAEADYLGQPVETLAAPFSFDDAEELRALFSSAGFPQVEVTAASHPVRFPAPERFVALTLLAAASLSPDTEAEDETARAELVRAVGREIGGTLERYVEGDTVSFPMHAHIAVGRT